MDYQVTKPNDLRKINATDFGELMWWCYILNVSPEKLITTIEKVGNSTEAVRKSLKEQ